MNHCLFSFHKFIFLSCILLLGMTSKAQWHDTIYFAAPHYGGSYEFLDWEELDSSHLLVPSYTQVGWINSRRAMLSYYSTNGVKLKSTPLPNDFSNFSESETFYLGSFKDVGYLSSAIKDSSAYTYMNRIYVDSIIWQVADSLQPFSSPIEAFNEDQAWFVDSDNFLRMDLESGYVLQTKNKDSLLPDSINGFDFKNYLNDGFDSQSHDTLIKYFSYYYYDISDQKAKRSIAVLKYHLAPLTLLAVENYIYVYSGSGKGEGVFENEFVNVKDSLVPNLSDTTTERWLHIEKLSGERVRTLKMNGSFINTGSNTYFLYAKTIVNGSYTLVHEECYFNDTIRSRASNEPCSRVLLFGKNNKLYYDKTFKGWGGLVENKVTKMSVNERGEAYFSVTTTNTPNYASLLVKVDTTGGHSLFKLTNNQQAHQTIEVNVHPNPFQGSIQIETNKVAEYRFRLFNLAGQFVHESEISGKQFFSINSEMIKPGLYLYQLERSINGEIVQKGKLIKQE